MHNGRHESNVVVRVCWHFAEWMWVHLEKVDSLVQVVIVVILFRGYV